MKISAKFRQLFQQADGKTLEDDNKDLEFALGAGFLDDKDTYGLDVAVEYDENDKPRLVAPYKFSEKKVNFASISDELLVDYHLEGLDDLLGNTKARSFTFTSGLPAIKGAEHDIVYLTDGNIDLYDHFRFYPITPNTVVVRLVFKTTSLRSLMINYSKEDFERALPDISNDLVYAWDLGLDVEDRTSSKRALGALDYLAGYLNDNLGVLLYDESLSINAQLADYRTIKAIQQNM